MTKQMIPAALFLFSVSLVTPGQAQGLPNYGAQNLQQNYAPQVPSFSQGNAYAPPRAAALSQPKDYTKMDPKAAFQRNTFVETVIQRNLFVGKDDPRQTGVKVAQSVTAVKVQPIANLSGGLASLSNAARSGVTASVADSTGQTKAASVSDGAIDLTARSRNPQTPPADEKKKPVNPPVKKP